jgi:predicted ATPase/class 3 adenylate cyclase
MPTGLVTFLFTDVEGSTQLWARDPETMSRALQRHDRMVESAITAHGGYVFSKAGDAFAAAFSSPVDAIRAAITAQRDLGGAELAGDEPLRVRMALHAGEAEERDGHYFGPPLNRCARLLEVTNGGQIVVSSVVAGLLDEPPEGLSLRDLGEHRLRDLAGTERVFDVGHPDLEGTARRRSRSAGRPNLPTRLTAFIGRADELVEVRSLMDRAPLVTLTGVGGVGKTRLALEAVGDRLMEFSGGLWYVDLAPLTGPEGVPDAVAKTMEVLERPPDPVMETLLEHLERRPTLLLLDNCEHVVGGVAKLVESALRRAPDLRVLVTSREALAISGELVHVVRPLDTTREGEGEASDAEALFVDRARLADPGFEWSEAVTEICDRLDRIPLAIELAAAWVRVLSPAQIARRLNDRFRLLTGGERLAAPHQQTLLSTMDWSYDQLTPVGQTLLRRLSVFRGDFTLEAATEVCGFGDVDPDDVVLLLHRLVETSLVDPVGEARFRLLETVREYGDHRRAELDPPGVLERRHAEYFLGAGPEGPDGVPGPGVRLEWFAFRDAEYDNYRAALEWALETGHLDLAAGLAVELGNYWLNSGCCMGEGERWLRAILDRLDSAPSQRRQRILTFAATQAIAAGQYEEAEALASEVEAIAGELDDPAAVASALTIRGSVAGVIGNLDDAVTLTRRAFEIARDLDDPRTTDKLLHLAMSLLSAGDFEAAERALDDHAVLVESQREEEERILQVMWRGILAYHRGDVEEADRRLREALDAMPDVVRSGVAFTRLHTARTALARGNAERAAAVARVVQDLARQVGDRLIEGDALVVEMLASVDLGDRAAASSALGAARTVLERSRSMMLAGRLAEARAALDLEHDPEAAATSLAVADALARLTGVTRPRPEQQRYEAMVAAARNELGDARFDWLWEPMVHLDPKAAMAQVLRS